MEALACGTPIIKYNTGGSPESGDERTGFVADKGNIDEVYSFIREIKTIGKNKYKNACMDRANRLFNYKDRYQDYISLFEELLD